MRIRLFVVVSIGIALLASRGWSPAAMQNQNDAIHGNGIIEPGEECDDGNLLDGDGCTAAALIEQQCYDVGNTFSFFTWSDSYTSAGNSGVERTFADAVSRARYPARVIPRFWVSTGDIPFMSEGDGVLDGLNDTLSNGPSGNKYPFTCTASNGKFPYFVAIGNHDIDGYGNLTPTPQSQYTYWSNVVGPKVPVTLVGISNFQWGPSQSHDQRTSYSFDYKNAHFVVVNQYHGDPAYPTSNPTACIRPPLYDWIDRDLAQTTRPIKFVFGHTQSWSYCSNVAGYGGEFCPASHPDNLTPAARPRPYSTTGPWEEPFGRHWGDSLEGPRCDPGSNQQFWAMLSRHAVVAHVTAHSHTYSSRLVQGDGTRRNDVSPYAKTGQLFDVRDGVWEVNTGQVHNSAGAVYVLTTVRDNIVTFEAFDQLSNEPFTPIETWSIHVGTAPATAIAGPAEGATFTEPALIPVAVDATDLDGTLTRVALYSGPTLLTTFGAPPYQFDWTTVLAGTYQLKVVATDNDNLTTMSTPVTITVNPSSGNHTPALSPLGNRTVDEQTLLTFTAAATDEDAGTLLTFSLVNAPAGAAIDAATGVFEWTPTEAQGPGTHRFTVRVRDDASPVASADETLVVTVTEVNQPPALSPIASLTGNELTAVTFTATATDADVPANTLSYSLVGAPSGATINAVTGAFTWTPTEAQGPGPYAFTVRVTDNGSPQAFADASAAVTVDEVNQAPTIPSISAKTVVEQQLLSFTVSATDPDHPATALTYALVNPPAGASIEASSGAFTWTPTPTQVGSNTLTVQVTDSATPPLSSTQSFTVTVQSAPDLIVSALSTATTVIASGSTLSASNSVRNQGGSSAGSSVVAFSLSPDSVYGNGDDVALTATRSVTLEAGVTSTATTTLSVPGTIAVGTYSLCAKADSANTIVEGDETNNTLCGASQVTVEPADLTVTAISTASTTVGQGATLSVSNAVRNGGGVSAGSFTIAFHLSQDAAYGGADDVAFTTTRTVASLGALATSTASTTLTLPATAATGDYFLCALADTANTVIESSEVNNGACTSSAIHVEANASPTAAIAQPADGTLYTAGSSVVITGTGTDPEDGTLPASAFSWVLLLHHDEHTHPFLSGTGVRTGSVTIPNTGETSANVYYHIELTVTDSNGQANTASRDLYPRKSNITLATNPPGLQLRLDGQPVTAPYTFTGVVGFIRSLAVTTPQTVSGVTYDFVSWSDGGAASHNLTTPSADTTLTATFAARGGGCTVPGAPTGLTLSEIGSTLTMTWVAPATGGAPGSYVIEAGNASGSSNLGVYDTGNTATSFSATVGPGTYFIRIKARNTCGTSGPSNEQSITVP